MLAGTANRESLWTDDTSLFVYFEVVFAPPPPPPPPRPLVEEKYRTGHIRIKSSVVRARARGLTS